MFHSGNFDIILFFSHFNTSPGTSKIPLSLCLSITNTSVILSTYTVVTEVWYIFEKTEITRKFAAARHAYRMNPQSARSVSFYPKRPCRAKIAWLFHAKSLIRQAKSGIARFLIIQKRKKHCSWRLSSKAVRIGFRFHFLIFAAIFSGKAILAIPKQYASLSGMLDDEAYSVI